MTDLDLLHDLSEDGVQFDDVLDLYMDNYDGSSQIMYMPNGISPMAAEDALFGVDSNLFDDFVSNVKHLLKQYKELDQISQKIPTYIPAPLRKKKSKSISSPESSSPLSTEVETTVEESSLPKLSNEQIVKHFQHHFKTSGFSNLELEGELNLYDAETFEVERVANVGESLMAQMFYNNMVSVEDSMMALLCSRFMRDGCCAGGG